MRVLFLDIDGCVHSGEDADEPTEYWVWLPLLVDLLEPHPDVVIVVHSSWRFERTLDELRGLLGALGPRVIDATPRAPRWESIQRWLAESGRAVSSWRVLDDTPAQFPSPMPPQLIVCDPARGVSDPKVQAALRAWLAE